MRVQGGQGNVLVLRDFVIKITENVAAADVQHGPSGDDSGDVLGRVFTVRLEDWLERLVFVVRVVESCAVDMLEHGLV